MFVPPCLVWFCLSVLYSAMRQKHMQDQIIFYPIRSFGLLLASVKRILDFGADERNSRFDQEAF